jgi:galactose mutarotase-like enzyme
VTSVVARGDERLFLDEATFADPVKNVRGGVPILYPIAGPAEAGSPMKQHGFARTLAWSEMAATDVRIELELRCDPSALFSHAFSLRFSLSLEGEAVKLEWLVSNVGSTHLPLQFGVHPYFRVPLAGMATARIETDATQGYNNRTHAFEAVQGSPSFGADEVDLHLLNHRAHCTQLHRGDGSVVRLDWSANFHTLVTWSLPGLPFICVEPWSAPAVAARAGSPLPSLAPRQSERFTLTIE